MRAGIPAVLKFQARVRVIPTGGETTSTDDEISVRNADSVLILIVAATSFKRFDDVTWRS